MYLRFVLSFGIICLVGNIMSIPTSKPVKNDQQALSLVSKSIGRFSGELTNAIYKDHDENLIMSSVSASIILAMASYGARGNTSQQMKSTLHLNNDDELDQKGFQTLTDQLNNAKDVTLKVANKMFLAGDLPLNKSYQELTENVFRSVSEQVDFRKTNEAVQKINGFCEEHTNGRIKELVTAGDIDASTKMFLVNALYFKGNWEEKFNSNLTSDMPFHVNENTVKNVPMMYKKAEFNYGDIEELGASFVEIPYKGKRFSMVIVVPNKTNGLEEMIPKLAKTSLHNVMKYGWDDTEVTLYLPKFKIESTLSLTEPLKKMGMMDAFTNEANFAGISQVPLQISAVMQKAFIEVNEEGSEAAAATGIGMVFMSLPPPPKVLKVDHPFAYFILDKSSNVALFSGYVRVPSM